LNFDLSAADPNNLIVISSQEIRLHSLAFCIHQLGEQTIFKFGMSNAFPTLVICTYPFSLPHLIFKEASWHLAVSLTGGHRLSGSWYSQAKLLILSRYKGNTFQSARWVLFDLVFRGLRPDYVQISNLGKVMHVFGSAGVLFIDEASAVIDDRCSMGCAGVRVAGGFSRG